MTLSSFPPLPETLSSSSVPGASSDPASRPSPGKVSATRQQHEEISVANPGQVRGSTLMLRELKSILSSEKAPQEEDA